MNEEIYKQNIIDHYRNPRHFGSLSDATVKADGVNPSCGDMLTLYLRVKEGVVVDVSFEAEGCAISVAAASMLAEKIYGMRLSDTRMLTPGHVYTMLGITISPGRSKCALLAYGALENALSQTRAYND